MDKYSVPGLLARYEKLNQKHDLLVRLNQVIPWEAFRPKLSQIHEKERKSPAGRKPTDVVVLFKAGETPASWADNPHRQAQKDSDARWTKKRGKSYFGYKDHIEIDAEHRLIRRYVVTDAAVWDGQVLGQLLDEDNDTDSIWGDSAYRSETIEAVLGWMGFESQIHERAYRNRPLSEDQTEHNREKSRIRARVEHVFGAWIMGMGGKFLRTIGLANAKVQLGLKNLTYNLIRFTWLETRAVKPASIAE